MDHHHTDHDRYYTTVVPNNGHNPEQRVVGSGRCIRHHRKCKSQSLAPNDFVDDYQVCLILLATCIYKSTTYGFGMRVADIKASGGDVIKAMKVHLASPFSLTS
jgi:hypothetical protein